MDHEPHVGLVDAHAERVRRHHDPDLVLDPFFLPQGAFGGGQSSVVGQRRDALVAQQRRHLFGALARAHVDDTRPRHVAHQTQQLAVLVIRAADAVGEIGAGEAASQQAGFGESQAVHDVVRDGFRGRSRERQDRNAGEFFAQFGDAQVRRPEVVAPLRDAVGFVDGDKLDVHPLDAQAERFGGQPLGRHVEEFYVAVGAVVQRDVDLPRCEARVDGDGRDAACAQAVDLVLHQGDERRHDDAEPLAGHRRHLVRQRLAAARGHQRQRVAPGQHRADDFQLYGPELAESPVAPQRFVCFFVARLHSTKIV